MRSHLDVPNTSSTWFESLPEHWQLSPIWALFRRGSRKGFAEETLLSVYREHGVVPKASRDDNNNRASEDLSTYQLVEPGDLVVNKMKAWQGSMAISRVRGIVSPAYYIYRPTHRSDDRYLHYLLRSQPMIGSYIAGSKGIRTNQWDLEPQVFTQTKVPTPPLEEQQAIADYLDRETQRIDALIAEQRGLIETMQERRQAVIDDSLSGSEKWAIVPLKYLIEHVEQGVSPQAESVPVRDEEWGVLKSGCVNRGIFHEKENKRLPDGFEIDESLAVRVGDVLVSRASGSVKFVGSCARVRSLGHRLILSDKTFRLVPRESVDADFLVWLLNSRVYREQIRLAVSGAQGLANNLPLSSLRSFTFRVPTNVDEQREVTAYLDDQTSHIDALIAESEDFIALSLERRAALITAGVTGQIDVRTAV